MTAPNPAPERRLYQITADRLREREPEAQILVLGTAATLIDQLV